MDYTTRTLTKDDLAAMAGVMANAFLSDDALASVTEVEGLVFEPDRTHGVFADGVLVGCGEINTRSVSVPGRGMTPMAAVTSVAVRSGHTRRGVMTNVMRTQLHGLHEAGAEPIAGLWASEASIYGRFGYGLATDFVRHEIAAKTPFRPGVDLGADRVREVTQAEAIALVKPLYERYAPTRVGAIGRADRHWDFLLHENDRRRGGASSLRFAVHPDGYASYRVKGGWTDQGPDGRVIVKELVATTARAYAALFRHLLDIDLIGQVEYDGATDEVLPLLLQTPRAAVRRRFDALFIRLVDVDRALMARGYASPVDVVIEVADDFCPWNACRWRFKVGADGSAVVTHTITAPDMSTTATDLGAAFLGGPRITTLAAAGRVVEHTPGAVAALSAAFLGEREPACLEVF